MDTKYKELEIDGKTYRIGLFSAITGHWIVNVLDKVSDETIFRKIQGHCLEACSLVKQMPDGQMVPVPIFDRSSSRFLIADLEHDLWTVNQLCEECLQFNLSPFLQRLKNKTGP
jgi:hypothetical protein